LPFGVASKLRRGPPPPPPKKGGRAHLTDPPAPPRVRRGLNYSAAASRPPFNPRGRNGRPPVPWCLSPAATEATAVAGRHPGRWAVETACSPVRAALGAGPVRTACAAPVHDLPSVGSRHSGCCWPQPCPQANTVGVLKRRRRPAVSQPLSAGRRRPAAHGSGRRAAASARG